MKTRNGLFADVPENLWNDWHWQVANRAETVEDLKKKPGFDLKEGDKIVSLVSLSMTPLKIDKILAIH